MPIRKMFILLLCLLIKTSGMQQAGLIVNGFDTLNTDKDYGYDFVVAQQCTIPGSTQQDCVGHLFYRWVGSHRSYDFCAGYNISGFGIPLGKLNLDSVKSAPADTTMQRLGGYTMDSIPPNALASRVGNVYVMKTGTDPRAIMNRPFYAKIKILKFIVHDTATHNIDMVFLWAANLSGYPDLTTAGLDTFHLDSIPVSLSSSHSVTTVKSSARPGLTVARTGVLVESSRGYWDLKGRRAYLISNKRIEAVIR